MTEEDPLHPSMSGSSWPGHAGLGPGVVRPGEMAAAVPASGTAALAAGTSARRRRGVRVTTAAAVALGLAVGGGVAGAAVSSASPTPSSSADGTALAATSGGTGQSGSTAQSGPMVGGCASPPTAVGTVKTIGDDTFTLTTASGSTVTVDVGSSTKYVDPSVSSASFSNVTVGEHVAVVGTESSNTVTATSVLIGVPAMGRGPAAFGPGGPGGPPAAVGTVKTVGDDTFTLTTASGSTVTVDVGSSTKYADPGVSSPSFSDVTVGQHVAVLGSESSGTITATSVLIGTPRFGAGPPPGLGSGSSSGTSSSSNNTTSDSVSAGFTTA